MIVWLNAWPMCSVPVTFGGGSWMLNEGLLASSVGAYRPLFSHSGVQRASMAAGSKALASSVMAAALLLRVSTRGGIGEFWIVGRGTLAADLTTRRPSMRPLLRRLLLISVS